MAKRTDAQKKADAAYRETRAQRFKTLRCQVPRAVAEEFEAACSDAGTNTNQVLSNAVKKYVKRKPMT